MSLIKIAKELKTGWAKVLTEMPREIWDDLEAAHAVEQDTFASELPTLPSLAAIFRCFRYFEPGNTRVVILGQDPYHGPGQATGLCFGVEKGTKPPPSLKNVAKELETDLDNSLSDFSLESWAKQGVLLLNTALTVRQHCPASHTRQWRPFTDYIIKHLNVNERGIVFLAWGRLAHRRLADIDQSRHSLLVSSHPSPLSCRRQYGLFPAFMGSRPFSQANEALIEAGKDKIIW